MGIQVRLGDTSGISPELGVNPSSKISVAINILQGSHCSLDPGKQQEYRNTIGEECLLVLIFCYLLKYYV